MITHIGLGLICLAAAPFPPQETSSSPEYFSARIVRFPHGRSLGTLKTLDVGTQKRHELTLHNWRDTTDWAEEWEYLGQARGDVIVPAGKWLGLQLNAEATKDISRLSSIGPNDLYRLGLQAEYVKCRWERSKVDGDWMRSLSRLTGLRELNADGIQVDARDFGYIESLQSLEFFTLPHMISDAALAHVARLRSLKGLYFGGNRVTNAGVRHLARLDMLEELFLGGGYRDRSGGGRSSKISDPALAHLSGLSSLKHLRLWGSFSDAAFIHLKKFPALTSLSLDGLKKISNVGMTRLAKFDRLEVLDLRRTRITDRGMAHLKKMGSLEKLSLCYVRISDKGLAYLQEIPSLRQLDVGASGCLANLRITDAGMAHVAGMKRLERLKLPPVGVGDEGMAHLRRLKNLEELWGPVLGVTDDGLKSLSRMDSLRVLRIGGYDVTDEGVAEIGKMAGLTSLDLYAGPLTGEGLAQLSTLKSLTRLNLTSLDIPLSGITALNEMGALTDLRVSRLVQDVSEMDLADLGDLERLRIEIQESLVSRPLDLSSLRDATKLQHLSIKAKQGVIDDANAAYLADLTSLASLEVRGRSDLTDEGLSHFSNLHRLDSLSVSGNFTDDGLQHLEGLERATSMRVNSGRRFCRDARDRLRDRLPNLESLSAR
jgi:hypothetical protein